MTHFINKYKKIRIFPNINHQRLLENKKFKNNINKQILNFKIKNKNLIVNC
jgi:hypothetical protein